MKYLLIATMLWFSHLAFAQVQFNVELQNPTQEIGDASCELQVTNGIPPFTYQWSKRDVALDSPVCKAMQEGTEYTITVMDSTGQSAVQTITVPAVSIEEKLNRWFTPLVDAMALVLLWDPFAACGIYDPVVYDDLGKAVLHPNGDPVTQDCWLVVVLLIAAAVWFKPFMLTTFAILK